SCDLGGRGLEMVTGIPYAWALLIAVGVIVFYTFLGGYLAVAYTDFVQAIIMLIGMLWIVIGTMQAIGGWTAGNEAVGQINPNLPTMVGPDGIESVPRGGCIGAVIVLSIGSLGLPPASVNARKST